MAVQSGRSSSPSSSQRRRVPSSGGISAAGEAGGVTSAPRTVFQVDEQALWMKKSRSSRSRSSNNNKSSGAESRDDWGGGGEDWEKTQEEQDGVSFYSDVHEEEKEKKGSELEEEGDGGHKEENKGMTNAEREPRQQEQRNWKLRQQLKKQQKALLEEEHSSMSPSHLLDCLLLELLRAYGPSLLALDPAGEAPDVEFYQAVLEAQHCLQEQQHQPLPEASWIKRRRRCDKNSVGEHVQGSWGYSCAQTQGSEQKRRRLVGITGMEAQTTNETPFLTEETRKQTPRHKESARDSMGGRFVGDLIAAVRLVMNVYVQEQEELLDEQEQCCSAVE